MKITVCLLAITLCGFSCTSTEDRRAGGGAWDDSQVGKALDANAPLPDDKPDTLQGFEEWRRR